MLVAEDTSTRIARIDDNHGNGTLVCKILNALEINLPTLIRKKIKIPCLKMAMCSTCIIVWESRFWKQNIGPRASENC